MKKKIVVIGGGTGNFTVLQGLKNYPVELSSIVSMADDGGSTGVLRDELGVLPPGDVRQCLVALSGSSRLMRSLMNYRFEDGCLQGHSFGNLFLSALEKVTGSFEKAVDEVGKVLLIKGKVIPVTINQTRLKMILNNKKLLDGECQIHESTEVDQGYTALYLEPFPTVNQRAIDEIRNADLIVLGPGGLYTSLIPNLLVEGMSKALRETQAKKVFVVNLINKKGQTTNFSTGDYLKEINRFTGRNVFDHVIINDGLPPEELVAKYKEEGDLVKDDLEDPKIIRANLLGNGFKEVQKGDLIKRNLIRHDSDKLAAELMKLVETC
ncbi:YvcK family protein [Candidatus Woesearchaeota archaeon]|nr:YvcK family protein [Candidatus Woesearchaeota archaeon]